MCANFGVGALEHVPLRLIHYRATNSVCSPPPCGEGLGVGVLEFGTVLHPHHPPPQPSPTSARLRASSTRYGGREQTSRVAPLCPNLTGTCSSPAPRTGNSSR